MPRSALRAAFPLPVARATVESCLDLDRPSDALFHAAWSRTLDAVPTHARSGALPGVIGHVAESVVELMLVERGYAPVAHHAGPGRHGVDLLCLHLEADLLLAVEVKGTLRSGRVPRLTRGDLEQMSPAWIDKPDNPAMSGSQLRSEDVYGAVAAIN